MFVQNPTSSVKAAKESLYEYYMSTYEDLKLAFKMLYLQ